MTTCKQATLEGLETLANNWKPLPNFDCKGGCFWMAANAFHTAVDCARRLHIKDSYSFAKDSVEFFEKKVPDQSDPAKWGTKYGFWVDDYGWWGVAFVTAYNFADALGYDADLKEKLGRYGVNCWTALHACWDDTPKVWSVGSKRVSITGGIPNTTGDGALTGRNAVTNECFWRLSEMVALAFGSQYLDSKTNEAHFFDQGKNQGVLYDIDVLVLQRFLETR
jgi:hypothetical protein